MLGSIKYNLTHLLDFTGRDARQTFWYYALFVFLLNMAVGMVMVVPFLGQLMTGVMSVARSGDPAAVEAAIATEMADMMGTMVWVSLFTGILNVGLLAAAFTRRLHDSNLAGWWGLLPLGLHVVTSYITFTQIEQFKEIMGTMMSRTADPQAALMAQSQMSGQSLLGWLAIIALIVLGARKSTPGPNRFAAEPVQF